MTYMIDKKSWEYAKREMRNNMRDKIIERIEKKTGSLLSMPYHLISTRDLIVLANEIYNKPIPEYWEYLNRKGE